MSEKLKAYYNAAKANVVAFVQANKAILIGFLSILAVFKFRDFLMDLLLNSAKRIGQQAQEKDKVLAEQESNANTQANHLIEQAEKAKEETPQADENWYKK
jgi:hypothetical protein